MFCFKNKNAADSQATNPSGLPSRTKWVQISVSLLANLTFLSPGMGLGFPSTTSEYLIKDRDTPLTDSQVSWFASITAIVMPIVGPLTAYLTMKIGRKGTLILINIISIISWILIGFSSRSDPHTLFIQLMIARSLIGASIGMITTPAVMYTSEICHPKIRGNLLVLSPFMLAFGMLVIYFLGYLMGVSKSISTHRWRHFHFSH
jgi:MFS family permease